MKILTLILSVVVISSINGQSIKKGLILPKEKFEACCIYLPTSGLNIYSKPAGAVIGNIKLGSPENEHNYYKTTVTINEEQHVLAYDNFHMVGYEIMAIKYEDQQKGFVNIGNGNWLSVQELNTKGLKLKSWMDYLTDKEGLRSWYANDPGLNLRKNPSTNSEIIETLKGDLYEITPTTETKGLWCKVNIKVYRKHPCSGEEDLIIKSLTGWVKLLSNEQTPNVWNYAKGC